MADSNESYICSLDKQTVKKAIEELNENPEDRLAAVQAFRDWIKDQPHIKCPQTDTIFLLRFLRWAKFSQIKAREKLECYLNFRNTIPVLYSNIDSKESLIQELIGAGYVYMLPKNHPDGNPILVIREVVLSQFDCPITSHLRTSITLMEYLQRKEINHVCGTLMLIDFTGATIGGMKKLMAKETAYALKEWMRCSTGRLGGFHLYRPAVFVDVVLSFFKPITKKKLFARIRTHDTMESVYRYIPKECLPIEFLPDDYTGPNAGTMEDCIKRTRNAVLEKDFHDYLLYRTSDAFGIDHSKKTGQVVTDHFRRLNVD